MAALEMICSGRTVAVQCALQFFHDAEVVHRARLVLAHSVDSLLLYLLATKHSVPVRGSSGTRRAWPAQLLYSVARRVLVTHRSQ